MGATTKKIPSLVTAKHALGKGGVHKRTDYVDKSVQIFFLGGNVSVHTFWYMGPKPQLALNAQTRPDWLPLIKTTD